MMAEEKAYLEASEEHASNKTYVNGFLALTCRFDQLLNGLVVVF